MSRQVTLHDLVHQLQDLIAKNPDAGNLMVCSVHSSSGCVDHLNSFHVHTLEKWDLENEFGFFYEDEGLKIGDKVIQLSVGGN